MMFQRQQQKDPAVRLEEDKIRTSKEQHASQLANTEEVIDYQRQQEKQDLLRWQQELPDELEQLKHDLRREVLTQEGWVKETIYVGDNEKGEPIYEELPSLMNSQGIRMVETAVRPLLSRNLINSNLTDEMVYGMLRRTSDAIVNNIAYYGIDQYDMEFGNFSYTVRLVKNVIIPTPFRAADGWTKKIDSTVSKRLESLNPTNRQEEEKGFFNKIFSR